MGLPRFLGLLLNTDPNLLNGLRAPCSAIVILLDGKGRPEACRVVTVTAVKEESDTVYLTLSPLEAWIRVGVIHKDASGVYTANGTRCVVFPASRDEGAFEEIVRLCAWHFGESFIDYRSPKTATIPALAS